MSPSLRHLVLVGRASASGRARRWARRSSEQVVDLGEDEVRESSCRRRRCSPGSRCRRRSRCEDRSRGRSELDARRRRRVRRGADAASAPTIPTTLPAPRRNQPRPYTSASPSLPPPDSPIKDRTIRFDHMQAGLRQGLSPHSVLACHGRKLPLQNVRNLQPQKLRASRSKAATQVSTDARSTHSSTVCSPAPIGPVDDAGDARLDQHARSPSSRSRDRTTGGRSGGRRAPRRSSPAPPARRGRA